MIALPGAVHALVRRRQRGDKLLRESTLGLMVDNQN
jgi:hypothetical protein